MADREALIRKIEVGDIFSAKDRHGVPPLCLATAIDEKTIYARRLFMDGETYEFDRKAGVADPNGAWCRIDSVAPLPLDIRQVLLGLDHRHRTGNNIEDEKLTESEKRALIFIYDFYRTNQI